MSSMVNSSKLPRAVSPARHTLVTESNSKTQTINNSQWFSSNSEDVYTKPLMFVGQNLSMQIDGKSYTNIQEFVDKKIPINSRDAS